MFTRPFPAPPSRSGLGDEPTRFPWWLIPAPAPASAPSPFFVSSPTPAPAPAPRESLPPAPSPIPAPAPVVIVQNQDGTTTAIPIATPAPAPVAPELLSSIDPDPGGTSGFIVDRPAPENASRAGIGWILGAALILVLLGSSNDEKRKG